MLLNSIANMLPENEKSGNTFVSDQTPCLIFRHYDAITYDDKVLLRYFVGPKNRPCEPTVGDTYTVAVTYNGNTVKKTTYKGYYEMEVSDLIMGESHIEVQVVDSNGVESPLHMLPIYRKVYNEPKVYTMTNEDLDTFGIVLGKDVTVQTAIANKKGLTDLFTWCKGHRYDKIVMVNGLYMIDYHKASMSGAGDDIEFPSGFTIDMNGAEVKVMQSVDLKQAQMIYIKNCIDTHIENGKITGSYHGFDFDETKKNMPGEIPGEQLCCIRIGNSKYCTLRNLEISNAVGYDNMYMNGDVSGIYSTGRCLFSDAKQGYIDYDGNVIEDEAMRYTDNYYSVGQETRLKFCQFLGMGGFFGSRREIFVSFYDNDRNFIKTIKTQQYYYVPVPGDARYFRLSAYGTAATLYPSDTSRGLRGMRSTDNVGIEIADCYLHDTRSCCLTDPTGYHFTYRNLRFERIGIERKYSVTPLLMDSEDQFQNYNYVFFDGCWLEGSGCNEFAFTYGFNVVFENCRNVVVRNVNGGLEKCMFLNNHFTQVQWTFNQKSPYPQSVWSNNKIDGLSIKTGEGCLDTNIDMWNCEVPEYIGIKNWKQ